jgi:hypothetical protein
MTVDLSLLEASAVKFSHMGGAFHLDSKSIAGSKMSGEIMGLAKCL